MRITELGQILRRPAVLALLLAAGLISGCSGKQASHEDHNHADKQAKAATTSTAGGKCAAHSAPAELCFICDPKVRDPKRLWCNEHARYEDRCWECHPEARDKNRLYCDEHGIYEDECFICHPDLVPKGKTGAQLPSSGAELMCKEHGVAEAECGICHPELATQPSGRPVKVRLPSAGSAGLAGVETANPIASTLGEGIDCYAEIAFDQNKLAHMVAPVAGILQAVEVDLGAKVKERDTVAKIWSAAIAGTVAKAVLSHQTLERERKLRAQRVTSEQALQEAEAAHRAACQEARTFGFDEAAIQELSARPDERVLLNVQAPFAGEVVERAAVRGALVEAGKLLFTIADRSTVWAMLSLPEAVLGRVEVGQTVEIQVEAIPGKTFTGKLSWIGAEVDERTRMARARAEIPNPDGLLRSRMFASARVLTRSREGALMLPESAFQHVEGKPLLFIRLGQDLFEARPVRLGARYKGEREVLQGLAPGEEVVVAGSYTLKSQLLISRLGAGCVDD